MDIQTGRVEVMVEAAAGNKDAVMVEITQMLEEDTTTRSRRRTNSAPCGTSRSSSSSGSGASSDDGSRPLEQRNVGFVARRLADALTWASFRVYRHWAKTNRGRALPFDRDQLFFLYAQFRDLLPEELVARLDNDDDDDDATLRAVNDSSVRVFYCARLFPNWLWSRIAAGITFADDVFITGERLRLSADNNEAFASLMADISRFSLEIPPPPSQHRPPDLPQQSLPDSSTANAKGPDETSQTLRPPSTVLSASPVTGSTCSAAVAAPAHRASKDTAASSSAAFSTTSSPPDDAASVDSATSGGPAPFALAHFLSQTQLLSHELAHVSQVRSTPGGLAPFLRTYMYLWLVHRRWGRHPIEKTAIRVAERVEPLLWEERGFFRWWRTDALWKVLGYPIETDWTEVKGGWLLDGVVEIGDSSGPDSAHLAALQPPVKRLLFQRGAMEMDNVSGLYRTVVAGRYSRWRGEPPSPVLSGNGSIIERDDGGVGHLEHEAPAWQQEEDRRRSGRNP